MILSALAAGTPSGAAPHGFKTRHGRGGYHTLIKQCLVLLPTDVGSYNPPPLEDQRPRWHIGRRLALITAQCNRTMILSALAAGTPSGAAPHGFKTRHGREGFHPLIRRALFSLPTDVGCYIPPPLRRPASPLAHRSGP
ncbi:hypothetical protein QVD17_24602 [Tagetes erecta]|uniref:Uncharacterized protein n=1 Tax=Tagetes erecta TaxID=13708 RepID=A0AAD8KF93_TARER|nr:hypothetical protein QVD17_24602 [Tagetes erecta]